MVLCNIATLLGVDPQSLNAWFWTTYVDAYIQRMGPSLCAGCQFDPAMTTGPGACPLNHLYWDFLERQRERLKSNVRMAVPLAALGRLAPAVMDEHRAHAAMWRDRARRGFEEQGGGVG